ncbi:MAG: hypothetical protein A2X58_09790, partial [Nitrospirae bacterium GWC2_56_14]
MNLRTEALAVRLILIVFAIGILLLPAGVFAGPALDEVTVLQQPSRTSFEARQRGDEWYNWTETRDGYGIFRNSETEFWEYYQPSPAGEGTASLTVGNAIVGIDDPVALGIPKGLRPSRTPDLSAPSGELLSGSAAAGGLTNGPAAAPVLGAKQLLVIGVDYVDAPALYTPAQIQPLLFGASSSVADYYAKTSYGAVSIAPAMETSGTSNNGFIGWIRLNGNHPNTGASTGTANQQIAKDAITAADAYIDYSQYDVNGDGLIDPTELSIIVIVAGYEQSYSSGNSPSIWGHRWSMWSVGYPVVDGKMIQQYAQFGERHGDHLATIGIMAHELGHLMFSLPDLYDTDSFNGSSLGVGDFDLMGMGSWGAAVAENAGSTPTQLSAWSKEYLSWGTVTTLASALSVTFPASDGNGSSTFRINTADPNQYFLIENRQFTGYDAGFLRAAGSSAHGGLAIYHIDNVKTGLWPSANTVNADETDKGVDVEEANEGALGYSILDNYYASSSTNMFFFQGDAQEFTNTSIPNTKLKNNTSTPVSITNISNYGASMSASVCTETISYSLSPTNASFPLLGGGGIVDLTASSSNCMWKAVSSAWWLQISSGFSGAGSGTVVYTVIQNTDGVPRTGYLTIAGQTFTVTQEAGVDTMPDPFSFTDQTGASLNTLISSNSISVSGIAAPASISVTNGEYEVNASGFWTTGAGTVVNGDSVRIRLMSSANSSTTTSAVLTIGGISDTFSVTTMENTGLWHQVQDSSTPTGRSFTSGSPTSWWYGQDATGTYDTPGTANKGSFIIGPYVITAGQSLTFWSWEETEKNAAYDKRTIAISTDNGSTWTDLATLSGMENQWYNFVTVLSAYTGQTVKFKFTFDTVDSGVNAFKGWYLDDISIIGGVPDTCAGAREITGATYTDTVDPTTATATGDDPMVTCGNGSRNGSVWYKYTATQDGALAIDTTGSNYDTILSAYTGNCGTLASLDCNDDTNGTQSSLSVPMSAGTTYYFMVSAYGTAGTVLQVNVTVSGGGGNCAEPVSPSPNLQDMGTGVNDLGEVIWAELLQDGTSGMSYHQIMSSTRGQLTSDANEHINPSVNNRGDLVWEQNSNIYGNLSGQVQQLTYSGNAMQPSINDKQEVVWSQTNGGNSQIYSNQRGWLTSDPNDHWDPAINNAGDVVWAQSSIVSGWHQLYKLPAGSSTPVQVTNNNADHWSPSISNTGEVVWTESNGGLARVYSSTRGQLTFDGCPGWTDHISASVNACGDVTFTVMGTVSQVYRLGNSSPCLTDIEPNDNTTEAILVSGNSTTTGMVQEPGDLEDWYKFTASVGDTITATVNWGPTAPPNGLMAELMDGG